jgi:hypothetical protein
LDRLGHRDQSSSGSSEARATERSSVAADGFAAALRAAARASDDVPQAALERHLGGTLPRRFEQFSKSLIRFQRAGEAEVNSAAAETAVVFTEVPQPAKLPRTASFLEIVLRSGHTHEKVRADALDLAGQLDFPGRF